MPGKEERGENKREREDPLEIENYSAVIKNDGELCLSTWNDISEYTK